MKPFYTTLYAIKNGLDDGWQRPELGTGWSHPRPVFSELYDAARNLGESLRDVVDETSALAKCTLAAISEKEK